MYGLGSFVLMTLDLFSQPFVFRLTCIITVTRLIQFVLKRSMLINGFEFEGSSRETKCQVMPSIVAGFKLLRGNLLFLIFAFLRGKSTKDSKTDMSAVLQSFKRKCTGAPISLISNRRILQ